MIKVFLKQIIRAYFSALKKGKVSIDGKVEKSEAIAVLNEMVAPALDIISDAEIPESKRGELGAVVEDVKAKVRVIGAILS